MTDASFTLVIPTYNRPEDLVRLVRYYADGGFKHPILVLDSSRPAVRAANAALLGQFDLDLRIREFDPETHPYEKFSAGLAGVETEFCALCADDDIVLMPALERCVAFLGRNPGFAAAHGHYVNMLARGPRVEICGIEQRGPSYDADRPAGRLWQLMSGYNVLVYAVVRTSVLRKAFARMAATTSVLFAELTAALQIVLAGKVARIPEIYCGRSIGISASYRNWHPHEILALDPARLLALYAPYRSAALADLAAAEPGVPADALARAFDYAHLAYFQPFFGGQVMGAFFARTLAGEAPEAVERAYWRDFVESGRKSRFVHPVCAYRARLEEWREAEREGRAPSSRIDGKIHDLLVESLDRGGAPRVYKLFDDFVFPEPGQRIPEAWVDTLIGELDRYR